MIAQPLDAAQGRAGLRLIFEDTGPGIPDIDAAMRDGFSTGRGLGKGLPGSKRLVDVFEIESDGRPRHARDHRALAVKERVPGVRCQMLVKLSALTSDI